MKLIYILAPCFLLASCGIFDNEQVRSIVEVINQIEREGGLSAVQAAALREAVIADSGEPWWIQVGKVVLEVGLAVAGVRLWRGPAATTAERAARIAAGAK